MVSTRDADGRGRSPSVFVCLFLAGNLEYRNYITPDTVVAMYIPTECSTFDF